MNINNFLNSGCFILDPNFNKIWALTNINTVEKNNANGFAFYKNNFFLTEKSPWLQGEHYYEIELFEFKELLSKATRIKPKIEWNEISQDNYKQQFDSLKKEICTGNLLKGVPFAHQTANLELCKENLAYLLNSLFEYECKEGLYLYGFWNLQQKIGFLGASPELLFTQKNNLIETYALAGTVRNNIKSENIQCKIIREHNFVVDGMQTELAALGDVHIDKTELLKLEQFSHLKSPLQLKLKKDFDFKQVLTAIHPTPALGAFPKKTGFKWLQYVEDKIEKRLNYCSPFGICINKNFSLCVGVIRCLQWENNSLKITAGGGVIEESIFEEEWEEVCMKLESIRQYFKI
ncbi:MAG: chorismate-binding protein [Bdellovibrionota bacterium]